MTDKLLTLREVADWLNIHTKTLRRWIAAGQIQAIKAGPRCWRFERKVIELWIVNHRTGTNDPPPEED